MIALTTNFSQLRIQSAPTSTKGDRHGKRPAKRESGAKKPKKEKIKVIAAAPSRKGIAWQPTFDSGKKK
jgi:hypothetical protein